MAQALINLMAACFEEEVADRPPTAGILADQLAHQLTPQPAPQPQAQSEPVVPPANPERLQPAQPAKLGKNNAWLWGIAAIALVSVLVYSAVINQPFTAVPTPTPRPTVAVAADTNAGANVPAAVDTHIVQLESGAEFTFVRVPAGEFTMGSEDGDSDELPMRTIALDEFWMMQTEVTNAQYQAFMAADGYSQRAYWSDAGWQWREANNISGPGANWRDADFNQPDQPVIDVSWYEAEAFANWLSSTTGFNLSLPTEAQWEKAARGTDGRIFPWGNEWDVNRVNAGGDDDGYARTAPVGSYPHGASSYGALDMAGNVWEWVADWYDTEAYATLSASNPTGPSDGTSRVLRGGAFYNSRNSVRCANRNSNSPDGRYDDVGFRVSSPGF